MAKKEEAIKWSVIVAVIGIVTFGFRLVDRGMASGSLTTTVADLKAIVAKQDEKVEQLEAICHENNAQWRELTVEVRGLNQRLDMLLKAMESQFNRSR